MTVFATAGLVGATTTVAAGFVLGHRRRAARRRDRDALHALFFVNSHIPMWVRELSGAPVLAVNRAALETFRFDEETFKAQSFFDLFESDDAAAVTELLAAVAGGRPSSRELRLRRGDGTVTDVRVHADPARVDGRDCVVVVARDITEQRVAELRLKESEERFRLTVEHSYDLILVIDDHGRIRYVNPASREVLGREPSELVDCDPTALVHPDDVTAARAAMGPLLAGATRSAALEARLLHADGSWRHIEAFTTNLLDVAGVGGIVVNARDVTERRRVEAQLAHRSLHDALTGLPNRELFADRVAHTLERRRSPDRPVAVLMCDLDQFKAVNDSFSHGAGDEVLVEVGRRFASVLRAGDTVARFGGDEFGVLLDDLTDVNQALLAADRLRGSLRAPLEVEGREVFLTTSVGITFANASATAASLLREADSALNIAKESGRDAQVIFDDDMRARIVERLAVATELRHAVALNELELHYQPVVDLATGEPEGVEALLRWRHPRRGLLAPDAFLSVAEESGLIETIGAWVVSEACTTIADIRRRTGRDLHVAVNVSPRQLVRSILFADMVRCALQASGLPADRLMLEITETTLMEERTLGLETLRRLAAGGVRIAVDDFGTGYSSLTYLKRLPVDTLKIDRSFVARVGHVREDTAIVKAIATLASSLQFDTVAEGIEAVEQAERLRGYGARLGQGFLWSRALPAAELEAWLNARARRSSTV